MPLRADSLILGQRAVSHPLLNPVLVTLTGNQLMGDVVVSPDFIP